TSRPSPVCSGGKGYLLRSFRRRPESRSGGAEADGMSAEPLEPASEPFHLDPSLRRDARVARAYLLRSFRRRPESRSGGAEADGIGAEPLEPASEPFHLDPGLRRDARVARAYLLRSFR